MPTTQLDRGWMNTNALTIIDARAKRPLNTVLLDDVDLGAANPWGVAVSADGKTLCVSHAGTHELSVIDAPGLLEKLARMAAAAGPGPAAAGPGRSPSPPAATVPRPPTCPTTWLSWSACGGGSAWRAAVPAAWPSSARRPTWRNTSATAWAWSISSPRPSSRPARSRWAPGRSPPSAAAARCSSTTPKSASSTGKAAQAAIPTPAPTA